MLWASDAGGGSSRSSSLHEREVGGPPSSGPSARSQAFSLRQRVVGLRPRICAACWRFPWQRAAGSSRERSRDLASV